MKKNYITPNMKYALGDFELILDVRNASIDNGQGEDLQHPVDYGGEDIEVGTKNRFYNNDSNNDFWE